MRLVSAAMTVALLLCSAPPAWALESRCIWVYGFTRKTNGVLVDGHGAYYYFDPESRERYNAFPSKGIPGYAYVAEDPCYPLPKVAQPTSAQPLPTPAPHPNPAGVIQALGAQQSYNPFPRQVAPSDTPPAIPAGRLAVGADCAHLGFYKFLIGGRPLGTFEARGLPPEYAGRKPGHVYFVEDGVPDGDRSILIVMSYLECAGEHPPFYGAAQGTSICEPHEEALTTVQTARCW